MGARMGRKKNTNFEFSCQEINVCQPQHCLTRFIANVRDSGQTRTEICKSRMSLIQTLVFILFFLVCAFVYFPLLCVCFVFPLVRVCVVVGVVVCVYICICTCSYVL
jgi:hypothetical protein